MKRSLAVVLTVLASFALFAVAVPAHADTDDFVFESFTADYHLGVDEEGRSTLTTVETFVAVFPDADQNRGLLRALVAGYDGHPTDIEIVSVTDENGLAREWHEADDDEGTGDSDFYELAIAGDDYVRGRQIYVVTYEQHNVTRFAADTGVDEFYWDTNGLGWNQPFGSVTANVVVPAELAASFRGGESCYVGGEGATEACDIATEEQDDGSLIVTASSQDVAPRENLTVAVAFAPGTFVPRDASFFASAFGWLQLVVAALSVAVLAWVLRLRRSVFRDGVGRRTIIAEYLPPKGLTLVDSALILGKPDRAAASQIIDLAVRRNIRVLEAGSRKKPEYTLELVTTDGLSSREPAFLAIFFGEEPEAGSHYTITTGDTARGKLVYDHVQAARTAAFDEGIRRKVSGAATFVPIVLASLAVVASFVFAVFMVVDARGGVLPFVVVGLAVLVAVVSFVVTTRSPLTDRGADLRDHLEGLRVYISLAEADRMRVLQSPEGAERVAMDPDDRSRMMRLNERVLPYAVLFALETRWAEEIGRYYEDSPPEWYGGSGAFNAAVFAASIATLSTSTSSSYSGTASSSSSGGSGGSGSSGGGGGGGGGGGL